MTGYDELSADDQKLIDDQVRQAFKTQRATKISFGPTPEIQLLNKTLFAPNSKTREPRASA